jgi:hypothetical protein
MKSSREIAMERLNKTMAEDAKLEKNPAAAALVRRGGLRGGLRKAEPQMHTDEHRYRNCDLRFKNFELRRADGAVPEYNRVG